MELYPDNVLMELYMVFNGNMKNRFWWIYCALCIVHCALLTSCRTDDVVYPSGNEVVTTDTMPGGLYVLNEGNMGSNKARIDYMNLRTGVYTSNIYGLQNPDQIKELGDVGNDIKVYGGRLYAVINCSHKVEVMDLQARRIGQVDLPNCRYLAFAGGKAYVSAYVGSMVDPDMLGSVYEVDTATLQVTREVKVGHQPDELTILGNRIYVCNSGGYLTNRYDSTLSVIDMTSFEVVNTIPVGLNPYMVRVDRYGKLWVTCRGNYGDVAPSLAVVEGDMVTKRFAVECDNISLSGDSLYVLDAKAKTLSVIHTQTLQITPQNTISSDLQTYEMPFGLLATPTGIYITDAKNYVSSGTLHAYSLSGLHRWQAKTGDIPGHLCLVGVNLGNIAPDTTTTTGGKYLAHVYEYMPAMGQFVNVMPKYAEGDDAEAMCRKCEKAIANNNGGMITLGGWGGYITFGFDHAVRNVQGERDFQILGNAFYMQGNTQYGSSEPGIVYVSRDVNRNGLPDDTWYELRGSEYDNPTTDHHYQKTYTRAGDTLQNAFHKQSYYPQWIAEDAITFEGVRLANTTEKISNMYVQRVLEYGYADNKPNTDTLGTSFDISWAVDADGNPVVLPSVDFIRVVTAIDYWNTVAGTGEISTEIAGAIDLHN